MNSLIKYFYFNKSERIALFVFLILVLVIEFGFRFFEEPEDSVHYEFMEIKTDWVAIDSLPVQLARTEASSKPIKVPERTVPKVKRKRIDLNYVDSLDLRQLPGIGEVYASRIVRYRNWLGGFYDKEQLLEVYGVDSTLYASVSPFLSIDKVNLTKKNINTASVKELASHPYISYKLGKLIVKYREHHGAYTSLEELKTIPLIDEQLFRKIAFYIELE